MPHGFHILAIQKVFDEVSPGLFLLKSSEEATTSSGREKSVRGEWKSICGVEVVDQTISLGDPSFEVSAGLLSG